MPREKYPKTMRRWCSFCYPMYDATTEESISIYQERSMMEAKFGVHWDETVHKLMSCRKRNHFWWFVYVCQKCGKRNETASSNRTFNRYG